MTDEIPAAWRQKILRLRDQAAVEEVLVLMQVEEEMAATGGRVHRDTASRLLSASMDRALYEGLLA